ncbi:hypothetical protein IW261DRAFT_1573028 [Armillaria novae-zelandiae]|uniref:Uncharacterized protein n=1 Tax=Armillaria novae-zelandiae TaxID=153914 RepID=A0AA39U4L4_9AGAR|nr:hypothetical protein IW261DRAFT_1573028 [Armillaria novae-zelandiae]
MANIICSAKSGSDWSSNDLISYNITIRRLSSDSFFGYKPHTIPDAIDPAFLTTTVPPDEHLSDGTYRLLQYLDLAMHANSGQESAIDDFAKELLRLLGFEERSAQTDLCLIQGTMTILLVIQEDKTLVSEAQVIAEAVAAFQYNNTARDHNGLDLRDSMTIPAIMMISTHPIFYKVPITQELSDAVTTGQYPVSKTEVIKCVVALTSHRLSEGMEVPEFRWEVLYHYEAFRKMLKECWKHFII